MLANTGPVSSTAELKDNTIIVVLGASGDLAKKKTVRSLCAPHLPPNQCLIYFVD